ncbi:S-adenosyl-L-methionine-dependent methyltransferase [Tirmania nivea]|nr:S-adenosyl-L-methionine-dependent methyltransferase [Tirmania nivea]
MAGARATNRGSIMPALANLMNPVEPDPYTPDHQQSARAQTYPPPQPQGSLGYNHNNANSINQTYGPSFSSLGLNREQSGAPISQNARHPAFSNPPRSHAIQLAPLSALTARLPPTNVTQSTNSSYLTAYQTSRPATKLFGGDLQFQSSEGYLLSSTRGSAYGSDGHSSHYGAMVTPLQNPSSCGWKDPTWMSSSSSTTSSTKSSSTSPQPSHWGHRLSPRRSSENVNGRSYATTMDYMFPNDAKEQERLDLSHKIYLLLMRGALHWAPIGNEPTRILDIGTGTGIWVIDMAEKYPNSTIIGTDVLNIQPVLGYAEHFRLIHIIQCLLRTPRNAYFEILDCESIWPWTEKFDYIHTRCLAGCVEDWPKLYAQAFHNLRPGGWIELQEYSTQVRHPDPNVSPRSNGSIIAKWEALFNEASMKSGRPPGIVVTENIQRELLKAGFVDVRQEVLMLPLGAWHPRREMKELGSYGLLNMLDGVEGFTLRLFTKYLGWSEHQCTRLIEDVRNEFKRGVTLYTAQYVVWGRKPAVGEIVCNGQGSRSPPGVKVPYPANGQYYYQ